MKSRKLKAILAALSAVAVMATAMTGFAAATTTYDLVNNKVEVTETVEADAGKEVTYLVKSNNQIVYIDQDTADDNGYVTFSYKIAGGKLASDLSTSATFGTDGTKVENGSAKLDLYDYSVNPTFNNCTVEYNQDIAGSEDNVTVTITAVGDYEIVSYTIDDGEPITYDASAITLTKGQKITAVETQLKQIDYVVTAFNAVADDADNSITGVIACTGNSGNAGIVLFDRAYQALKVENSNAAVKIVLPSDRYNAAKLVNEVKAYYGEHYYTPDAN